ncbi:MAG TPA: hypothetical protein VKA08_05555 [Balneolales bacterium]|nr:hypothetical protein [Balneolales bacterium]
MYHATGEILTRYSSATPNTTTCHPPRRMTSGIEQRWWHMNGSVPGADEIIRDPKPIPGTSGIDSRMTFLLWGLSMVVVIACTPYTAIVILRPRPQPCPGQPSRGPKDLVASSNDGCHMSGTVPVRTRSYGILSRSREHPGSTAG